MQINKNLTPNQVLELAKVLYPNAEWQKDWHPNQTIIHAKQKQRGQLVGGVYLIQYNQPTGELFAMTGMLDTIVFDETEIKTIEGFLQNI